MIAPRRDFQHSTIIAERTTYALLADFDFKSADDRIFLGRSFLRLPHPEPSEPNHKIPATGTDGHVRHPYTQRGSLARNRNPNTPPPRRIIQSTARLSDRLPYAKIRTGRTFKSIIHFRENTTTPTNQGYTRNRPVAGNISGHDHADSAIFHMADRHWRSIASHSTLNLKFAQPEQERRDRNQDRNDADNHLCSESVCHHQTISASRTSRHTVVRDRQ